MAATENNAAQYPNSWDEYVGQERAKEELQLAIQSAHMRGANLGHILISSPYAGIGKSALMYLVARYMQREVIERAGAMTPAEVRMMFSQVDDGDICLYDEVHKVMDGGKKNAEWLLKYLWEGIHMTPWGPEDVPQITIIGATTDLGVLPEPIQQRFKIIELEPYTNEQAAGIALGMSRKVLAKEGLPELNEGSAQQVAVASSNQPRLMRKLLVSLRDLALCERIPAPEGGSYDLVKALEFSGLTVDGLPRDAQKYLRVLYQEMKMEPAGATLIRERMGLVGRGLQMVEALLLDKNLIQKTRQGRVLTSGGSKRARRLVDTGQ